MTRPAPGGPLPQWTAIKLGGPYEAVDPAGTTWRLWAVYSPTADDPFPAGWRLAPRDDLGNVSFISGIGGLFHAMDMAGLRIAADAVRADPGGARRQLGLDNSLPSDQATTERNDPNEH